MRLTGGRLGAQESKQQLKKRAYVVLTCRDAKAAREVRKVVRRLPPASCHATAHCIFGALHLLHAPRARLRLGLTRQCGERRW